MLASNHHLSKTQISKNYKILTSSFRPCHTSWSWSFQSTFTRRCTRTWTWCSKNLARSSLGSARSSSPRLWLTFSTYTLREMRWLMSISYKREVAGTCYRSITTSSMSTCWKETILASLIFLGPCSKMRTSTLKSGFLGKTRWNATLLSWVIVLRRCWYSAYRISIGYKWSSRRFLSSSWLRREGSCKRYSPSSLRPLRSYNKIRSLLAKKK